MRVAIALLIAYSAFITVRYWQFDQPQRVCVPLYDETGLECCVS